MKTEHPRAAARARTIVEAGKTSHIETRHNTIIACTSPPPDAFACDLRSSGTFSARCCTMARSVCGKTGAEACGKANDKQGAMNSDLNTMTGAIDAQFPDLRAAIRAG